MKDIFEDYASELSPEEYKELMAEHNFPIRFMPCASHLESKFSVNIYRNDSI